MPPTPTLITAVEVATGLGWDVDDADVIEDIDQSLLYVTDLVQQFCGARLYAEDATTKVFDGSGLVIQSFGFFMRELTSVAYVDTNGATTAITDAVIRPNPPQLVDGDGINLYTWMERRQYTDEETSRNIFPKGLANLEITGDWGMTILPLQIKKAIILSVKHDFNLRGYDATKELESGFGRTTSFKGSETLSYLPPVAQKLLAPWRYNSLAE